MCCVVPELRKIFHAPVYVRTYVVQPTFSDRNHPGHKCKDGLIHENEDQTVLAFTPRIVHTINSTTTAVPGIIQAIPQAVTCIAACALLLVYVWPGFCTEYLLFECLSGRKIQGPFFVFILLILTMVKRSLYIHHERYYIKHIPEVFREIHTHSPDVPPFRPSELRVADADQDMHISGRSSAVPTS